MSKLSTAWRLLRTNRREMLLAALDNLGLTKRTPDESYIKMKWRAKMGTRLDLEHPKTFNEKLQWLKLYDRRPEYTIMVDKYKAKEYVAGKIGEEHIIPLLGVWERAEDIDFDGLPNEFVLKCNHNSGGGMCICRDKAKLDTAQVKKGLARALKDDYYMHGREWPYKDVPRRIIAEKYMTDGLETGGGLRDYKLFCFNGKCRLVLVCTERVTGNLTRTFYDRDWQRLPIKYKSSPNQEQINKPKNLGEMIAFAELLANSIPFARIDFYEIEGKTYFGEITFYPESGHNEFSPEEWDATLGDWIELPPVQQAAGRQ